MKIYISQGHWGRTIAGWTLHVSGCVTESFATLAEAKATAVFAGASGKWRREVRIDVGHKKRTYYFDANEKDGE